MTAEVRHARVKVCYCHRKQVTPDSSSGSTPSLSSICSNSIILPRPSNQCKKGAFRKHPTIKRPWCSDWIEFKANPMGNQNINRTQ